MELFSDLLGWFAGDEFRSIDGIPQLTVQHLGLSAAAVAVAIILALPAAVWLGHAGRGGTVAINLANAFRAVPAFGLVLLAFSVAGFSTAAMVGVFALIGLAPIFTNAYVGVRNVDPEIRDAARGMGLGGWQLLTRVELPLAIPVVMAGVRTSAVNVVATVPLAAVVGLDNNLGRPIISGLAQGESAGARALVLGGAAAVALLSMLTEFLLGRLERRLTPAGLRQPGRPAPVAP